LTYTFTLTLTLTRTRDTDADLNLYLAIDLHMYVDPASDSVLVGRTDTQETAMSYVNWADGEPSYTSDLQNEARMRPVCLYSGSHVVSWHSMVRDGGVLNASSSRLKMNTPAVTFQRTHDHLFTDPRGYL